MEPYSIRISYLPIYVCVCVCMCVCVHASLYM